MACVKRVRDADAAEMSKAESFAPHSTSHWASGLRSLRIAGSLQNGRRFALACQQRRRTKASHNSSKEKSGTASSLAREGAVPVGGPGDAKAFPGLAEGRGEFLSVAGERERLARVVARPHREQEREV